MMKNPPMTSSVHNGPKVAQLHNARDPRVVSKEDHIDPNGHFEIWYHEMAQDAFERIFGDSVEEYNDRQPDKRRQIDNYYQHINRSKQKNPCYEVIVTIGNKDYCPLEFVSRSIVKEYTLGWEKRNPNLELIGAYWHADEPGAPHAHITYIPVSYENKRGMRTQCSQSGALREMGFRNTRGKCRETELTQWGHREREALDDICRAHGIEIHHPDAGKGKKHLEKEAYILTQQIAELEADKVAAEKENEYLNTEQLLLNYHKQKSQEELAQIKKEIEKIKDSDSFVKTAVDFYGAFLQVSIDHEFDPAVEKVAKLVKQQMEEDRAFREEKDRANSYDDRYLSGEDYDL
ncbi:MAG: plasmid recombination protein [Clostridia bacterium]|nr:plasmid recombination protein [Clostridia bacterium]